MTAPRPPFAATLARRSLLSAAPALLLATAAGCSRTESGDAASPASEDRGGSTSASRGDAARLVDAVVLQDDPTAAARRLARFDWQGTTPVVIVHPSDEQGWAPAIDAAVAAGAAAPIIAADPRLRPAVASLRAPGARPVLLGPSLGSRGRLLRRLRMARLAPLLPHGRVLAFDDVRMIAHYGSAPYPELGLLGEKPPAEAIAAIQDRAKEYEPLVEEDVEAAMELIVTVASGDPKRKNASQLLRVTDQRPWVEPAGEAGVHVILDLQPGHDTFLEQAKVYERLLRLPHVSLALDPEWRLAPGQRHLEQIGSVDVDEVNEVADWLADLVRQRNLPQKVLVIHQFTESMIRNRERLRTDHDELAVVIHADGHGAPEDKLATWSRVRADLPQRVRMGWKNFLDEDTPMMTPKETVERVGPTPHLVTYQ